MPAGEVDSLIIIFILLSPFVFTLSVYSLRYYAALYEVSTASVDKFMSQLPLPLSLLFRGSIKEQHIHDPQYSREQIVSSWQFQRVIAGIIPFLFLVGSGIRIIYDFSAKNEIVASYLIVVCVLNVSLIFSWRFGRKFHVFSENNRS